MWANRKLASVFVWTYILEERIKICLFLHITTLQMSFYIKMWSLILNLRDHFGHFGGENVCLLFLARCKACVNTDNISVVYIEVTSNNCTFDSTLWILPMVKAADRCTDYCKRGKTNIVASPSHVCGQSSPVAQRSKPCVKRSHRWWFNEWWTTGAPSGINTSRGSIFLWKTWIKLAVDNTNVIFSRSWGFWLFGWQRYLDLLVISSRGGSRFGCLTTTSRAITCSSSWSGAPKCLPMWATGVCVHACVCPVMHWWAAQCVFLPPDFSLKPDVDGSIPTWKVWWRWKTTWDVHKESPNQAFFFPDFISLYIFLHKHTLGMIVCIKPSAVGPELHVSTADL